MLEEFIEGEEASYFIIVDKYDFRFFGTAQDHKRAFENDKGPNTGGMGAYSPAPIIDKNIEKKNYLKNYKTNIECSKKEKKIL